MTPSSPPGRWREQVLVQRLDEINELAEELRADLPNVNDSDLRPKLVSIVETTTLLFATQGTEPRPTIADDLVVLLSAVRALPAPYRDPDLGVTPTLERIRKSKGLILASLIEALEAAEALGLRAERPSFLQGIAADFPRAGAEGLLRGVVNRLAAVEIALNSLDKEKESTPNFAQQRGLLNFYIGSMTRLGQPDGISPSRMAEMLEVDKAGSEVRC